MWEVLLRAPLGSISKRKFIMLAATFLVVTFGYLFLSPASTPAAALGLPDAIEDRVTHSAKWSGESISYDAKDFDGPFTAKENDRSTLPKDTIYYATYDANSSSSGALPKGYLIYFAKNADPSTATKALYLEADYDPASGRFSNPSPPKDILLDASTRGNEETLQPSSCDVNGIGWIICPVSKWIAEGMDRLYGLIESYLVFTPLSDGNNGIYQMWRIVLNLANIAFIIAFLVLIYAQITGNFVSAYNLKKLLPRVVVAAVLVNTSFWICALGVDISNVAGSSVQQLFMSMFDQLGAANSVTDDIGWEKVTAVALGGGSLAALGLFGATGGGAGALAFLIIGALVPALFAVFVAVIILAARQALLTLLIIIAPLAFVAYLLPNTEEWFNRWRKFFISLLVMFPAFAVVFGGSQLAGKLIIQNASNISVVILGLVVQVVPLFVTPFLIKLSSGLLSTIVGLTNDKSKGVFDNARNWAKGNQDYHKARAINRGLQPKSRRSGIRPLTTAGARIAMSSKNREAKTQALMNGAEGLYASRTRAGRKTAHLQNVSQQYQDYAKNRNEERYQDYLTGAGLSYRGERIPLYKTPQSRSESLRHIAHESHRAHSDAGALKEVLEAEGEAHYQATLAGATPGDGTRAGQIRAAKIQTVNLSGQAEVSKNLIQKEGEELLKRTIQQSDALTQRVVQAHQFEKTAEQYDTIVQQAAKESYDNYSRTNAQAQALRMQAVDATNAANLAETRWNTVIEESYAQGASADSVIGPNADIAQRLQDRQVQQTAEDERIKSAKFSQQRNIVKAFTDDSDLRDYAGGVEGVAGATRIQAQFTKEFVDESVKAVMTNRALTSQLTRGQLKKMVYEKVGTDGRPVTTEMQQAAMYELLQEKGNNMDAQEIRDAITDKGFYTDEETGRFYEYKRDANGRVIRGANGYPEVDYSTERTADEVSDRRDWQQFFEDAAKGSGHSISSLSGTDKSSSKAGNLVDDTRFGFMRDAKGGKFGPEKILKMDIDELKILREDIENPNGAYMQLNAADQAKVNTALEDAITALQVHPSFKGQIDDRNRGLMNDILAQVNPAYDTGRRDSNGNRIFNTRADNSIVTADSTDAERSFTAPISVSYNPEESIFTKRTIID